MSILQTAQRVSLVALLTVSSVTFPSINWAQGRCMTTFGSPACNTDDIPPVFASTDWKTVALDHVTFEVPDYKKEAAFYIALMGWTMRRDDGTQAVLDIGDWGTVVLKQPSPTAAAAGNAARAVVTSFGFVIEPWHAVTVEAELRKRELSPVADNGANGFESFHVKDPDGFDLQIGNGNGHARDRKARPPATAPTALPFNSTRWNTVWLDHLSYNARNYKRSASFYRNLLGWQPTYDEGSQHELMIADVGDIIIRGGNPLAPESGQANRTRQGIDHISFGIAPWDTDGVKRDLETRGLKATIDTSSRHKGPDGSWVADDIHTAAFKSYHTDTPGGYNLQISYVTRDNRLALATAVNPAKVSGPK